MIRILLGQRSRLLRDTLAAGLSQHDDLSVVAEIARSDDGFSVALRERPQVIVLDSTLPGTVTAHQLCSALCQELPDSRTLVMWDNQSGANPNRALTQLVPRVGLITTEATLSELARSVRQIARGEPVIDVELAVAALTADASPFTKREQDVLSLAKDGASAKEIARSLYLTVGTVRNYLSRAVAKTGRRSRFEAIRTAQEAGWI